MQNHKLSLLILAFVISLILTACAAPTPTLNPNPPLTIPPTMTPAPLNPAGSGPLVPTFTPIQKPPRAEAGFAVWLYDQNEQQSKQVIDWLNELNVKWVRHQLSWLHHEPAKGEYKWERIDRVVNTLSEVKKNIILNPVHSPAWACKCSPGLPDNPQDFADFMTAVANRYKGKVAAYEIWNEPNLDREAGTPIDPVRFYRTLRAGYLAVKAVDPNAVVVMGALTPTGIDDPDHAIDDVKFLKQLFAINNGEVKKYYDVMGAHPGSNNNPPDTFYPDKPGPGTGPAGCRPSCWRDHPSFYFRRIEQIRQIMVDNGDIAKQMWITEFGWASTPNPAEGFGYAAVNTEDLQAQYIYRALEKAKTEYDYIGVMALFQLNYALPSVLDDPNNEIVAWGVIRRDGSKRPSFYAVQRHAKP